MLHESCFSVALVFCINNYIVLFNNTHNKTVDNIVMGHITLANWGAFYGIPFVGGRRSTLHLDRCAYSSAIILGET